MSDIRVAVIGAGIGGLTLCVALGKQSNIKIDLYEAAREFGEVGAGIGIHRRTQLVLEKLGLYDDMAAAANQATTNTPSQDAFLFRKSDQSEGLSFHEGYSAGNLWLFHRSKFQNTIIKHLSPTCTSHFNKRLIYYDDPVSGPILLHFKDGTTAECDVLIGADGLKSPVRIMMLSNLAKEGKISQDVAAEQNPVWSGTVAYRSLISKERLKAKAPGHRVLTRPAIYWGKSKHLVVYPINSSQINAAAFCSDLSKEGTQYSDDSRDWMADASQEEVLKQYEGWEPEVRAVLECFGVSSRWAVNVVKPLSTYVSGRVAILGDAAHAMTPHLGAGAGQAIEDAYVLAALLSSPQCTSASLSRVLQIYDEVRRPNAIDVWNHSRRNGWLYEFDESIQEEFGLSGDDFSSETLAKMGQAVDINLTWDHTAEGDKEQALALLSQREQALALSSHL